MNRLKKHAHTLAFLSKTQPKTAHSIIKTADKDLIKCLCECAHNILKGNVHLSSIQKTKLKRHKQRLRALENKQTKIKKKRTILQSGGFLPAILAPLIGTIIAPLASSLLNALGNSQK